ncbi:YhgE/Pip domain-containing protein [Lactococcus formosensis]|uniref:YhgE/Pip domain-containing protein n=1 Tax=Lactococcus formosensis TaxID=1281486 RepID=A0A9X4P5G5_9LACT|nr:YhgE/Pip domain-containing protein [Lactococcus formosensis]MDG6141790.1 YhgE/Pip domain-containing protein [Lactococcus formosensis]MDG6156050.1 YhgE/Pip domain-containing protein [Lactococcus formosensis]MDG6158994.1 YhgE/Pip domain-containing protein [Lactococcus formosensis]MDG6166600.1 YhgE/Pip domain-containing protein [Lactococcus formosensis]MDG6171681.1 YhgE/Pip domain-containing protein [Lactococcus formosensis]
MKHIKNTGKLFILDWKRIFKNPIAIFLVVALMFIPSLYAWFNIKALWDPYANTSQLPIAVYSDDRTEKFQDKSINIGDEVLKNLKENKQLGWKFVDSKQELDKGVKSGKYYAGIYLPADFSKNLLSFTTGDIQKPKIVYSINEKINAIAPKITSKGASSLQSQISEEFIKTASSTLLKTFNDIGYDIDKNMVSIQKIKNTILSTNDNLDTIDQYTQQVVDLHGKMPDLKAKLAKANEFIDYLPEVDALGQKVVQLDDSMPTVKNQLAIIMTLQEKIPEIQNAGKQIAMIDNDFASVEQTMNEGIQEAKQGLTIIQQVQTALPDIRKLGNQANDLASTTLDGATQLQNALPSITSSVEVTLKALQNVADSTSSIVSTIKQAIADGQLTDDEKAKIDSLVKAYQASVPQQQEAIKNLIDFLQKAQESAGNNEFDAAIKNLNDLSALLGDISTRLGKVNEFVQAGDISSVEAYLDQIDDLAKNISSLVSQIDVQDITTKVQNVLTQLIATIKNAQGLLTQAQAIDFESLLSSTSKTVSNAITLLEKYQKEMPAIKQEVHDANIMLNGNMNTIVNAINKGASLYQNELPVVEQKLDKAADFVKNDYPGIRKDLTETLGTVNQKMPDLEKALNQANDLIVNDWPGIKTGIRKAADAIRKGEKEVDLGEIVKLLKLDATKESDFLTQPVEVQENAIHPIANNGSASTPFYTALCLWVGAVLFSSVAVTGFHLEGKDKLLYSKREQFSARMLTFIVMGLGQALIVTLGNYFGLGVDVRNPVYSVLFALLIAITFMIMVYVLVALFGNIGKGIAIIILVLSISGGGGNYPIQVSGKFFQAINPYLPFTHAVNLLRESAGGIYWPNAWLAIIILVAVSIVFLVAGLIFFPHLEKTSRKISEMAQKSHIFH